jgi:glycosyltransferase involved in cell wall biosynthesis
MKILMIAPEPFFEERGTPYSILGRLAAVSRLGHEVDLLTYPFGQDVTIPGVVIRRTLRLPFVHRVRIGPSVIKLILDCLLVAAAIRRLLTTRYDLVHTHEEAGFFGVVLARLFRIPHVWDMHSSLPEQLVNFRYSSFRPLIRLFDWLERRSIRQSAGVITVYPALAAHVRRIHARVPHAMIENVLGDADLEPASPEDLARLRAAYDCLGRRAVVYAGTLEAYQGIDLLIASAPIVVARRPDAVFVVVGGTPEQVRDHAQVVAARGLAAHFRFPGRQPRKRAHQFIAMADVLVSPRTHGTNTPLKLYAYLRARRPIVATDILAHTQILTHEAAVLVDADACGLAGGILSVLGDPDLGARLARGARTVFERRGDMPTVLAHTEGLLRAAAGREP